MGVTPRFFDYNTKTEGVGSHTLHYNTKTMGVEPSYPVTTRKRGLSAPTSLLQHENGGCHAANQRMTIAEIVSDIHSYNSNTGGVGSLPPTLESP